MFRICQTSGKSSLRLAGIPVYLTGGGAKGYSYDPEEDLPGHAWNFVKYNGEFYLLDATWDSAGKYENGAYTEGTESWKYFLVEPEDFIPDHLPEDEIHQFLESPVSEEEFRSSDSSGGNPSTLTEDFFNYNIAFKSGIIPELSVEDGYTSFVMESDYPLSAYIPSDDGASLLSDPAGEDWEFFISFFAPGSCNLYLYVSDGDESHIIGNFRFTAEMEDPAGGIITRYSKADDYGFDLITPGPHGFEGTPPHTLSLDANPGASASEWYYDAWEEGNFMGSIELSSSEEGTGLTASLEPPENCKKIAVMAKEGDLNSWWYIYFFPYGDTVVSREPGTRGLDADGTVLPVWPEAPRSRPTMPER